MKNTKLTPDHQHHIQRAVSIHIPHARPPRRSGCDRIAKLRFKREYLHSPIETPAHRKPLSIYEQWRRETLREGMQKGMQEGKLEGIQDTILTIYRTRFGHVPENLEQKVRHETDGAALMSWCNLFTLGSADEIARKLAL